MDDVTQMPYIVVPVAMAPVIIVIVIVTACVYVPSDPYEDFLARYSKQGTDAAVQTTPCSSPLPKMRSKTSTPASEQMSESFANKSQDCLESLAEDFAKLLEEGSDPDVELHCEGSSYMAHKAVLSVRSPVLAKMLHSDMVEGRTGVPKIEDMDQDTFRLFLRYLYTGRLDEALTFDAAVRLYEVGDMYGVKSLARRCSRFLIQNLTVENSCDALAVANAHSDEDLEEMVTDYVIENKVPMSDLWTAFCEGHPKLANKVYRQFCRRLFK